MNSLEALNDYQNQLEASPQKLEALQGRITMLQSAYERAAEAAADQKQLLVFTGDKGAGKEAPHSSDG